MGNGCHRGGKLTRAQYEDYLDGKPIKQDYIDFLEGKPVTIAATTTGSSIVFFFSVVFISFNLS